MEVFEMLKVWKKLNVKKVKKLRSKIRTKNPTKIASIELLLPKIALQKASEKYNNLQVFWL